MENEQSSGRLRALVADKLAQIGVDMLKTDFEVDVKTGLSEEALCEIIGNYHALLVSSATTVTRRVLDNAPDLRVIGRAGAGLDNINVSAAREKGVEVVNAPQANTRAVAEYTMGLLLALARHLPRADAGMKAGRWEKSALLGIGLYGKTLGLIGFGKIGREVAARANAFGMKVVVNQPRITPELALDAGVELMSLPDMLKQADFVSIHVPLNAETTGLIGARELALMKPTAYLINTARGAVVDEQALVAALNGNRLAGAAIDVFIKEPAVESELARHPRVVAAPHIAAATRDAQHAAAATVARQIIDLLADTAQNNPLSLQILPSEKVLPHEQIDPARVARLVSRLEKEKTLKNPPIVTEWDGNYVVLDGATRVTALKEMKCKYIAAQVVPHSSDSLTVEAWRHVIQGISPKKLLQLIEDLPEVRYVQVDPAYVQDSMIELGGMSHLLLAGGRVFVIQPAPGGSRLDAINNLVEAYINLGQVDRILVDNFEEARLEYPEMTGLIVFPSFTIEQILQISSVGKVVPAGITRLIIPGRVLRLNLDMERLQKDEPFAAKAIWFSQTLRDLMANHKVRYYEEPVYLLDE